MGYLNDFYIALDKDTNCGYISVSDQTTYPYGGNARTDYGIAIFYSKDAFDTTEGAVLNNSDSGWTFSALNGYTYLVRAFVVPVWSAGSWASNSIVWHSGYFYHNSSGGASSEEPGSGSDWDALTESSHAIFKAHLIDAGMIDYGYTEESEELDCIAFSVEQTSSHEWTLTDGSGGATINKCRLLDYEGNKVEDLTFVNEEVDITLDEDGAYIVYISYDSERVYIPIFDMSDAKTCMIALTKYVFCKCSDPCDQDCWDDEAINRRRIELNNMQALYWPVLGMLHRDRVEMMGVIAADETRLDFVSTVGLMIEKLNVIPERCGLCNDDDTNDINC